MSILAKFLVAGPRDTTFIGPTDLAPKPAYIFDAKAEERRRNIALSRERMLAMGASDPIGMIGEHIEAGKGRSLLDKIMLGLSAALQLPAQLRPDLGPLAPGRPASGTAARTRSSTRTIPTRMRPIGPAAERAAAYRIEAVHRVADRPTPAEPTREQALRNYFAQLPTAESGTGAPPEPFQRRNEIGLTSQDQPQSITDPYAGSAGSPHPGDWRKSRTIEEWFARPHPELSQQELDDLRQTYLQSVGNPYTPFGKKPLPGRAIPDMREPLGDPNSPLSANDRFAYQEALLGLQTTRPTQREIAEHLASGQPIDDPGLLRRDPRGVTAAQNAREWANRHIPDPLSQKSFDPRNPYEDRTDLQPSTERRYDRLASEAWRTTAAGKRYPAHEFPIASQTETDPKLGRKFSPKQYQVEGSLYIDAAHLPTSLFKDAPDLINLDKPIPPEQFAKLLERVGSPEAVAFLKQASRRPDLQRILVRHGLSTKDRAAATGALTFGTLPERLPARALLDVLNALSPTSLRGNALFEQLGYTRGYGRVHGYSLPSAPDIPTTSLKDTKRAYYRQWGGRPK